MRRARRAPSEGVLLPRLARGELLLVAGEDEARVLRQRLDQATQVLRPQFDE